MNETLLCQLISHVDNLSDGMLRTASFKQWSSESRQQLLSAVKEQESSAGGICWETVADELEGRTPQCCRCQYYSIMRGNEELRREHGIKKAIKWPPTDTKRIEKMIDDGTDIGQIIEQFSEYSEFEVRNKVNYLKGKRKRETSEKYEVDRSVTTHI